MKQMVVLFALVACSIASPAVTSYSFNEVAPMVQYYNHIPSMYKAFPYAGSYMASPYVASPYVASPYVASPYVASPYVASPYAASSYVASPYVAAPVVAKVAPVTPYVSSVVGLKSQYHSQDHMTGQAAYGHAEPGQVHNAVQDAAGNKVGSFSHVLPDGSVAQTNYVADAMGYRVSSNALPVHSVAPVSDTVEVMAAKAAHFAEVEKAKMRSKRAIAYTSSPAYTFGSSYAAPISTYTYPHVSNYAYTTPYNYGSALNYHYY